MPDNLQVDLIISDDKAEVVIGENRQRLGDFVRDVQNAKPELQLKVAGQSFVDLDKLEKKAGDARKSFQNIAATRIDSGQINNLTREIVKSSERARQLEKEISDIKRELANPNRASSIKVLTDELIAAEKEADGLTRKLSALPGATGATGGRALTGGAGNLRLSSFQKTNLAYQANDVATMAALGSDPLRILASQGGQIAQTFSGEQIAAFTAKYAALIPILGLGTAALALTYKLTGDIRDAAEVRLKTEEKIAGILNKQRLAAQALTDEFNKQRRDAAEARRIQYFQEDAPIDQIKSRKALLEQLLSLRANDTTEQGASTIAKFRNELLQLDNQLADFDRKQQLATRTSPDAAFDQRKADYKRNAELERESIARKQLEDYQKAIEAAEKFKKSVETGKTQVKEMGKAWEQTFDNLILKANSANPFVQVFTDARRALDKLREDIKALPPEMQASAIALQQRINARQLIETRVDNRLGAFGLRDEAANFRNPYDADKTKQEQEKFVAAYLRRNPNYLYLKRQEYDARERVTGDKNTESFEEFYRRDLLKRAEAITDTPKNRLNKRLEEQYDLLYKPGQSADEQAIADKRFISLTQGVNPLDLTDRLREQAAQVREREAARRENFERDALQVAKDQLDVSRKLLIAQNKYNEIVEKGGAEALKTQIEIVDKSNGGANVLGATPKPQNMLGAGAIGLTGGSGGLSNY